MTEIIFEDKIYKVHHVYNLYAASNDGYIIHIVKRKPNKGKKNNYGYLTISVRKYGEKAFKNYKCHRFIFECFYGVIPNKMQVDHIDDDRENNKLSNLQLLTPSQNIKKSIKNRKHFNSHANRKSVKSINKSTKEVLYFFSMYSAEQHLNICQKSIQDVCDGITRSAQSNKDNCWYKFEYVDKDLPVNYIKSKNIRPRKKTDQQIRERIKNYQTKDWKCPNCDKVIQNHSKYDHKKHCNQ